MFARKTLLMVGVVAVLTACGGGGGGVAETPAAVVVNAAATDISCVDWYRQQTAVGTLFNNVWNVQLAGSAPHKQCIKVRGPATAREYGWSWSWPENGTSVYSYPSTYFGRSPWEGGPTGDTPSTQFPIQVNAIQKFTFNHTVELNSNGRQNLVTSMWLTRDNIVRDTRVTSNIVTEFMIWTHDNTGFNPSALKVGEFTDINGITFEVWSNPLQFDHSGANANTWSYIAYRTKINYLSISLDIKGILNDAVAKGLLDPLLYVANLELGNEIVNGTGELWIKSLSLVVQ